MSSAIAVTELMSFFVAMVKRVLEAVSGFGVVHDARSLEAFIEEQVKALGAVLMETAWRIRMREQDIPASLACACGQRQHRQNKKSRTLRTVLGSVELEERYYYRCDHCGASCFIGDELRGETDFSQLAEDRIAYVGTDEAYEKGARTLDRLGLMKVAGSTIRRVCLRLGARLKKKSEEDARRQYEPDGVQPEDRPSRMAIGVDGVMVGRVDEQHRERKSEKKGPVPGKGKLKHFFHEVKTLVMFSFDEAGEALRKTFYTTQERVEAFREQVALEAHRRQAHMAELLVFLGDGAAWVWKTAQDLFPNAIQVLDWYHAMEHVWAVGRAGFKNSEKELWAWVKSRETELWEGRVSDVVEAVRAVSAQLGVPDLSLSENVRATDPRWIAHRGIHYFEENASRMDYPRYRAQNLPIGSGVVESACKHVVAERLKGSGMRWDELGGESVLNLRCEDLNGRWDRLWPAPSKSKAS